MSDRSKYKDREWLRNQYVENGLTQYDIADKCGVTQAEISRWMDRLDIQANGQSKAQNPDAKVELLSDEGWLREKYHGNSLTIYEIGDMCNVHGATVAKYMRKMGIERREGTEKQTVHADSMKFTDPYWLEKEYSEKERATEDIAKECGVSQKTISNHLKANDIPVRDRVQTGEDHPQWNGGSPVYQLYDWRQARENTFEKYGKACLSCGMGPDEHIEAFGTSLHVHHIEPIATFDDPRDANTVDNLVPLCAECHRKYEGKDTSAEEIKNGEVA